MGVSDIVNGHPESGFLQVEYLIRRTVSAACLFAIGITDFPMFAGYGFTVGSQHIELCNSGNICLLYTSKGCNGRLRSDRTVSAHSIPLSVLLPDC